MNASELVGRAVVVDGTWGGVAMYVTADGWLAVREHGTRRCDEVQAERVRTDPT